MHAKFVRAACLFAMLVGVALSAAGFAFAADDEKGWTNLLEGRGFKNNWTTTGNWTADDEGVVTLTPRPGERGWQRYDAYLWSNKEYQDFEIQFDYKVQKSGNSGFYFRVGDKKTPVEKGIEVQIYESNAKGKDARLTDHDSGGVIPGVPPTKNTAKPAGEWNQFHITNQGDKLTIRLNGEVVNEVDLKKEPLASRPKRGYIGFQDHGLPLALKEIKIREL
jgi:hypothetical protein